MQYIKLKDVCEKKILNINKDTIGLIDYFDISSIDNETKKIVSYQTVEVTEAPSRAKQILQTKDILISTVRPNLNAVAIYDMENNNLPVASTGFCVLRCKKNVDYGYVYYYCLSKKFIKDLVLQATGASYPAVSTTIIKDSEFPYCNIELQRRIFKNLDTVQSLLNKRRKQIEACNELIKSRFIEMFGDPVEDSMRWGQKPLSYYLESIRYGTSSPPQFSNEGYAFIRATNIKEGHIVKTDMKFISHYEAEKIEKCRLSGGEMIIVRSGVNSGDTCIITDEYTGQYAGYDMILVFKEKINPIFVNVLINTEYMNKVVKPLTRRAAQPHLNSEQVQGLPILNVPIDLQNQFALFVQEVDKLKITFEKSLAECKDYFNALMNKYFGDDNDGEL